MSVNGGRTLEIPLSVGRTTPVRFSVNSPYFRVVQVDSPVEIRLSASSDPIPLEAGEEVSFTARGGKSFDYVYVSNQAAGGLLKLFVSDDVCLSDFSDGEGDGARSLIAGWYPRQYDGAGHAVITRSGRTDQWVQGIAGGTRRTGPVGNNEFWGIFKTINAVGGSSDYGLGYGMYLPSYMGSVVNVGPGDVEYRLNFGRMWMNTDLSGGGNVWSYVGWGGHRSFGSAFRTMRSHSFGFLSIGGESSWRALWAVDNDDFLTQADVSQPLPGYADTEFHKAGISFGRRGGERFARWYLDDALVLEVTEPEVLAPALGTDEYSGAPGMAVRCDAVGSGAACAIEHAELYRND